MIPLIPIIYSCTVFVSEWHTSVFEEPLDMETVDEPTLAKRLTKFYCEARPQVKDQELQAYHIYLFQNGI